MKKKERKVLLWSAFVEVISSGLPNRMSTQSRPRTQLRPPEGAGDTRSELVRSDRSSAIRRSESERVLGVGSLSIGFVPVARRQALFRVVVLRVYPNVQHLGVRARLSESWEKHTTESMSSSEKHGAANIFTSVAVQIIESREYICKTPETTL